MKHLNKLLNGIIAAVSAFAMALVLIPTGALAADATYKLTLNGTAEGHTYEAYQIFTGDLSTSGDSKVLSNVKWGTGVTYKGTETAAEVAEKLANNTMNLSDLEDKLTLTKPVKTVQSSKDSTVIDGLSAGYYLVKDKDGTQKDKGDAYTKFIVQVVGDTTSDIKSGVPTVTKKVKDTNDSKAGSTTDWQDSADYDINDWVPYQITGTMPSNIADYTSYKYVFTDTMSKGLTYSSTDADHKATIKIGDTDVTKYFTENVTTNDDGSTTVTWTCNDLKKAGVTLTADTKVVVNYSAKLNGNAVIGAAGNPNEVNLTYSNNPNKGGEGETGKTPNDKNIVFTYKVTVNKVDQDNKPLSGASFTLYKKGTDGKYTEVGQMTADTATQFSFKGLDDGDYELRETTTPAGYNTMSPIDFTIAAEHDANSDDPKLTSLTGNKADGSVFLTAQQTEDKAYTGELTADIQNKKGSVLPSTGGMGTTVLYVAGAAIIVAAGLGLAKRRSAHKDAE